MCIYPRISQWVREGHKGFIQSQGFSCVDIEGSFIDRPIIWCSQSFLWHQGGTPTGPWHIRGKRDLYVMLIFPREGSSQVSRKSQWVISSWRLLSILTRRWVRIPLEMAKFISLVNRGAPGTASEKKTHLPMSRWRVSTDMVLQANVWWAILRNFSFLAGMRWKACWTESERNPKIAELAAARLRSSAVCNWEYEPRVRSTWSWLLWRSSIYNNQGTPIEWRKLVVTRSNKRRDFPAKREGVINKIPPTPPDPKIVVTYVSQQTVIISWFII